MPTLRVYKNTTLVQELELDNSSFITIGRSSQADIKLDPEAGISREHFQILGSAQGSFELKIQSQFGVLSEDGDTLTGSLPLKSQMTFSVGVYRFEWNPRTSPQTEGSASGSGSASSSAAQVLLEASESGDKTVVGLVKSTGYLKVVDPSGQIHSQFKLEGEEWTAGRDPACPLFIDNSKFSRRHFEVSLQGHQYFIRDLKSSNGTKLNGAPVSSTQWIPLKSGDLIRVVDWSLQFEVRDVNFQEKALQYGGHLPAIVSSQGLDYPLAPGQQHQHLPSPWDPNGHAVGPYGPNGEHQGGFPPQGYSAPRFGSREWIEANKKLVWYAALGLGILVLAITFSPDDEPAVDAATKKATMSPFERLSPEQKDYVRQSYSLGQKLMTEGRYELARQEMIKIHQLIPSFEDSKQIEEMADTAIKTIKEQQLIETQEKERQEADRKIAVKAAECKQNLRPDWDQAKLESCLAPVLALGPDHSDIQALRAQVEKFTQDRNLREAARQDRLEQEQKLRGMIRQAENLIKEGELQDGLQLLAKAAQSGLYDSSGLKEKARARIRSLNKDEQKRIQDLKIKLRESLDKKDLKNAIVSHKKLQNLGIEDEELRERVNKATLEHRKIMQALFQEAALEESIGDVNAAIAKWKKVLESSYSGEEYYDKSQLKLSKYGIN